MKVNTTILLLTALLLTGCYGTLRGKIVDAETGAPIEGAVAMAEWTKTKGLGNTYTVSAKVVEAVSDKDGNIELEGCYSPFVDKPSLTIYKKGYVAWNNVLIFPSRKVREGFEWGNGQMFTMERLPEKADFIAHYNFINHVAKPYSETSNKKNFLDSYNGWEGRKFIEQMNSLNNN